MIVAKFGGTSVADASAIKRVVEIVRKRAARAEPSDGHPASSSKQLVVVVSAFAGVTDDLLEAGRLAASGNLKAALDKTAALRARTLTIAAELLGTVAAPANARAMQSRKGPAQIQHPSVWDIEAQLATLEELLRGTNALREFSPRTSDAVVSTGELVSSRLIAAALQAVGVRAEFVDARKCIVTSSQHVRAWPLMARTEAALNEKVVPVLKRGAVPIIGGFVGANVNGITTTLGRGGSDFSAAVIARCLGAERVEIWTDVDGIMTCDPRICPDARTVDEISFEEAAQLAWFGAKVVHPATLVPAVEKDIPVHVLNSLNPAGPSTRITRHTASHSRPVKAVAAKPGVSVFAVSGERSPDPKGFLQNVFNVFDRNGLQLELVCSAENSVSVAVAPRDRVDELRTELQQVGKVEYEPGKAIMCLVGEDLLGLPDVIARVFGALQGISVRMISQGASRMNIALVVDEPQMATAVRRLHAALFDAEGVSLQQLDSVDEFERGRASAH
jgi:aspartate kinase